MKYALVNSATINKNNNSRYAVCSDPPFMIQDALHD